MRYRLTFTTEAREALRSLESTTDRSPDMLMNESKQFRLLGPDGFYLSSTPGLLGGHRKTRVYGRMDCRAALRALARGGYREHRVFFADEATAIACGYRPCGTCMLEAYARWKAAQATAR